MHCSRILSAALALSRRIDPSSLDLPDAEVRESVVIIYSAYLFFIIILSQNNEFPNKMSAHSELLEHHSIDTLCLATSVPKKNVILAS
jgi:hypothetical protein